MNTDPAPSAAAVERTIEHERALIAEAIAHGREWLVAARHRRRACASARRSSPSRDALAPPAGVHIVPLWTLDQRNHDDRRGARALA